MYKLRNFFTIATLFCTAYASADMPREYYPDNLEGRNRGDLKTELHKLIKEHTRIQYGSNGTWVVFRQSDIRPDGSIWDMYSGVVRYFPASGAHKDMNIEHSVPKSWWGDTYPYKVDGSFDLHHLTPSDAEANTAKSNYALGEVEGTPSYDNGYTRIGKATGQSFNVFEPHDEYKGDFARMYMYFVTCYQDYTWVSLGRNMFTTGTYPTLNAYSQDLLLKWHRQDPVSKKEIDRNNAVYEFQHNRNPFIDYPQLAEYIWGDSTEYAFHFSGAAVAAASLDIADGSVIACGSEVLGGSHSIQYTIKGEYITSPVRLYVDNDNSFGITPYELTPEDVTSDSGATFTITFHPLEYGLHEASLRLECDNIPDDITVQLRGLCMSIEPAVVSIDNLKASYSRSASDFLLALRNNSESVEWAVDGNALTGNTFSPSSLSVGTHIISFKTARITGRVRVVITD